VNIFFIWKVNGGHLVMIFGRKKHKRSEWFEGLLWAESLPRKDLSEYIVSGGGLGRGDKSQGVISYYLHRQNILDQIENK
jgi:hypothetical protein